MNNFIIHESAYTSAPQITSRKLDVLEFTAILQECDRKNRNGRIYPKRVLEEAIRSPYIQERLEKRTLYAECGHPIADQSIARQMTIDVRNAVCLIKELWWEGNMLYGKCETLNTQLGRDFKGLIEQGCIAGFSLRAQGKVHRDNTLDALVVDAPISIATWDFVVNPSHDQAFLQTVCEETYNSLIKPSSFKSKELALTEAVNLFENGSMISLSGPSEETVDYAKTYSKGIKMLSECYFAAEDDLVEQINENYAYLRRGDNSVAKVATPDFVTKDIRIRMRDLGTIRPTIIAANTETAPEITSFDEVTGEEK